jgi:hypothetical protein
VSIHRYTQIIKTTAVRHYPITETGQSLPGCCERCRVLIEAQYPQISALVEYGLGVTTRSEGCIDHDSGRDGVENSQDL